MQNINKKGQENIQPILLAVLAAVLYGINAPISKLLLEKIPPTFMAAFLYLGAGLGMLLLKRFRKAIGTKGVEAKLTKKERPYVIGMIALDILAPILLMVGLSLSTAANAALMNNFEIVATTLIALCIFKESIGKRMWIAIVFITFSSMILSFEDLSSLSFSIGSLFVLLACCAWGLENNCTRMLSLKDPLQIVMLKGFGSGLGSLMIATVLREQVPPMRYMAIALLLGFVAYGLSIYFYVSAQRNLGAARTSTYYAAAPFIGVLISWVVLKEQATGTFFVALALMLVGVYFAVTEKHRHYHHHEPEMHEHKHNHHDGHHLHHHDTPEGEHTHVHTHEPLDHNHKHSPDMHHRHTHD